MAAWDFSCKGKQIVRRQQTSTNQFENWDAVDREIDRLIANSAETFDSNTTANTKDLLTLCQARCPLPEGVAKGYWSTIRLWWGNFEIEVFEDRYELYRFFDQKTDIEYVGHMPSRTFSPGFLAQLPSLT
jgi:hypothetical protein